MKVWKYGFLVLAIFVFFRCGGSSSEEDGDVTQDGDVTLDDVFDVVHDDVPDIPGEDAGDTPPDVPLDETPDTPPDESSDMYDCPLPPECEEPLVRGFENAFDEFGCITGYCCTGIDVELEGIGVSSRLELTVTGSAAVENIGDTAIMIATLECEVRNPVDDSLVATCGELTLVTDEPLGVGASIDVELAPECTLVGAEPCFDPVDFVCTFTWSTIGCYSDGEGTVTESVTFLCAG